MIDWIANFVTFAQSDRTGVIRGIDEKRMTSIEANVAPGFLVNGQVIALTAELSAAELTDGVEFSFAGEAEDQQGIMIFLATAFAAAIFLMFVLWCCS